VFKGGDVGKQTKEKDDDGEGLAGSVIDQDEVGARGKVTNRFNAGAGGGGRPKDVVVPKPSVAFEQADDEGFVEASVGEGLTKTQEGTQTIEPQGARVRSEEHAFRNLHVLAKTAHSGRVENPTMAGARSSGRNMSDAGGRGVASIAKRTKGGSRTSGRHHRSRMTDASVADHARRGLVISASFEVDRRPPPAPRGTL
jgi:hypothetical protein